MSSKALFLIEKAAESGKDFSRYGGVNPAEYFRLRRLGQASDEYFGDNEHYGFNKDGSKRQHKPWTEIMKTYWLMYPIIIFWAQDDFLRSVIIANR